MAAELEKPAVQTMAERRLEWANAQLTRTACARCRAHFDGTLEEGRAWFTNHRQRVHKDVIEDMPTPRRARRSG